MRKGMEYFVLSARRGNPVPQIGSWYGKLDIRKLNREDYKKLPEYFLADMKTGMDILYPDILLAPFLMVSREAMEVIRMYEEKMPFLYVALIDAQKRENKSYYCPVLAEGDGGYREAVYRVRKGNDWEIRIRLDLAESLLLRGAEGMELTLPEEEGKGNGIWGKSIW